MRKLFFVFCLLKVSTTFAQIAYNPLVEKQVILEPHFSGSEPTFIETGDFDGDGDLDIFIHKNKWLENIDGNFLNAHIIQDNLPSMEAMEIADLDSDGDLDILFSMEGENQVLWYANDGTGSFTQVGTICGCPTVKSMDAADIDNDGDTDVMISYDNVNGYNQLKWFENDGEEKFTSQNVSFESGSIPQSNILKVTLADIDNDGDQDLVYFNQLSSEHDSVVRRNLGSNQWETLEIFFGNYAEIIDLNGDGFLDITTGRSSYYFNDGTGNFFSLNFIDFPTIEYYEDFITILFPQYFIFDVDNDGHNDYVAAYSPRNKLLWSKNNEGLFSKNLYESKINIHSSNDHSLLKGDFNQDGFEDILMVGNRKVSWYENDKMGGFEKEHLIAYSLFSSVHLRQMDVNKDQESDLLFLDSHLLIWFENTGTGTFQQKMNILDNDNNKTRYHLEVEDLDSNGFKDIVYSYHEEDTAKISWFAQQSDATYQHHTITTSIQYPIDFDMEDIDKDGDIDIVLLHQEGIAIYKNQGNNIFSEKVYTLHNEFSPSPRNRDYNKLQIVDLNNDNKLDIIALNRKLHWFEQDNNGEYTIEHLILTDAYVPAGHSDTDPKDSFEIIDTNADGYPDIIYFLNDRLIELRINNKDNTFSESIHIDNSGLILEPFLLIDIDTDGDKDIISYDYSPSLLENLGFNNYNQIQFTEDIIHMYSKLPIDIDGDNDMDIIATYADDTSLKLAILENVYSSADIQAFTFLDQNENGIQDENEPFINNQTIRLLPKELTNFTNNEGIIQFKVNPGEYELVYEPQTLWELSTPNLSYHITINDNSELERYTFGVKPRRILHRAKPYLSSGITRCDREVPFWLNILNTGTTMANGTVSLLVNDLAEFISADPPPDFVEFDKLFWNINNLPPSHEKKIQLRYQMPNFQATGQGIEMYANVLLYNEDNALVYSKEAEYTSEIRCSYDPNDKLAFTDQYGKDSLTWLQDTLYYTIRFQNTGNDTAFNVRITDQLDENLQWNSFHPLTSSHKMKPEIDRETGKVTFLFEDILLPDSTINEPESHGFVTYSVNPIENLKKGRTIRNTAFIYFDYNPAIITNTTEHRAEPLEIISTNTDLEVQMEIYPNPSSEYWQIKIESLAQIQNYQLSLYESSGKLLQSYTDLQNGTNLIERKGLRSGIYFLQLQDEAGKILGMGKLLVE